jgi:hypothetical protein
MCRSLGVPVSISEPSTIAGGFRPREAQPVLPAVSALPRATWGFTVGPLGSDEILLEGAENRVRAWAPPGVPLSGTADEVLKSWRVAISLLGQALDPTAFSDVSTVAVGEVLDAVPTTLHGWVNTMTHRALARLELFLRTGMRVADHPMTTAQAATADLRRELSESDRARRSPLRVPRRACGVVDDARIAIDASVDAHVHQLVAALAAEVFELSLKHQRWRARFESLHDHDIGCTSASNYLRELCGSSLWRSYDVYPEKLLHRDRKVVTEMSCAPAVVDLKHLAPDGQVFSCSSPDGHLSPDGFKAYDDPSTCENAGHAFLSAAGWAIGRRRDCEQAEHLIHRRLLDVWSERYEPDARTADCAIRIRALRAILARHAAQPGQVPCRVCEEDSDVGRRHVSVTEQDGRADVLARTVQAHAVPTSVVMILGSFAHRTQVSSLECDVEVGELLVGISALDFAFERSLHYLPKLAGASTAARSASRKRSSEPLPSRGSGQGWRLGVHTPGSCGVCAAPAAESTHCSSPLSMV